MAAQARSRALHPKFAFLVSDPSGGLTLSKFQQCTGGEVSFAEATYSEGGAAAPMKESTRATFANYTLQRGIDSNLDFYNWCLEIVNILLFAPMGAGVASPGQLRNLRIDKLKRDRMIFRSVKCFNCQPVRFNPGDQDNTSDDIDIEELEFMYEYFAVDNQ